MTDKTKDSTYRPQPITGLLFDSGDWVRVGDPFSLYESARFVMGRARAGRKVTPVDAVFRIQSVMDDRGREFAYDVTGENTGSCRVFRHGANGFRVVRTILERSDA